MTNFEPTQVNPLMSLIETRQTALGLTESQLCTAMGFQKETALALIKSGAMRMPLNKLPALAKALELDPATLVSAALSESEPALAQVIQDVFNPMRLTATEVNLINHLRKLSGDQPTTPIVFDGQRVIALVAA